MVSLMVVMVVGKADKEEVWEIGYRSLCCSDVIFVYV